MTIAIVGCDMEIQLFDSELKVMEALWKHDELPAAQLAKMLGDEIGWNRNTTYTVIKKLIGKGVIERTDPNFICKALITREQAQEWKTNELIDKMFAGSAEKFFSAFLSQKSISKDDIRKLRQIVEKHSGVSE